MTSLKTTHSHGPHVTRLSIRWMKENAKAITYSHQAHLVPTHCLLAQQREMGFFFAGYELRNLFAEVAKKRMRAEGGAEITDTQRMLEDLNASADILYVALFFVADGSGNDLGKRVQAKVISKADKPQFMELSSSDLQRLKTGMYHGSATDLLFYDSSGMIIQVGKHTTTLRSATLHHTLAHCATP